MTICTDPTGPAPVGISTSSETILDGVDVPSSREGPQGGWRVE